MYSRGMGLVITPIDTIGKVHRIGPEPAMPAPPQIVLTPPIVTTTTPTAAPTSTTTPGIPVPTPAQQLTIFGLSPTIVYVGGGLLAAWLLFGRKS